MDWLTAEREKVSRWRGRVLSRLAAHPDLPPDRALSIVRAWGDIEPFNRDAATQLVTRLEQLGRATEAAASRAELAIRFRNAGIDWSPESAVADRSRTGGRAGATTARQ